MAEFLISRANGAPADSIPVDELGVPMFFQMWRTRQDPYETLTDGDTLWWVDQRTREARWEFRVTNLRRARYGSVAAALDWLRRWFGLLPSDLTAYHLEAPPEGWLLAWENTIVGPVGVTLPSDARLGRNGFRRLDPDVARMIGLPVPDRAPLFAVAPIDDAAPPLATPRVRHIPLATRRAVFARDGHCCRQCSATSALMHIDHIYAWSKGGSNDLDNLQVLCATCNMAKGAALTGDTPVLPVLPEVVELAGRVGLQVPHSTDGLEHLVVTAVAAGEHRAAVELAWALYHHPDGDFEILHAVDGALAGVRGELASHVELFTLLAEVETDDDRLAGFVSSPVREVSERAAAELSTREDLDKSERTRLARLALEASDPRVRAIAAVTVGALTDDDDEWREMFNFAIDHGDPHTRSLAALYYGVDVDDRDLAYELLEMALRSPSTLIASEAARMLAERFDDEPAIAARYLQIANELDTDDGGIDDREI